MELIDLPLQGRRYTWSSRRHNPSFVRLDRVLLSNKWNSKYPNTTQQALQSELSDHCPLQCTVVTGFPLPNTFRFENYWLQMTEFKDLVINSWHSTAVALTPLQLSNKMKKLRQEIAKWNKDRLGSIDTQASSCNRALQWISTAEEIRPLTTLEQLLRQLLADRLEKTEKLTEIKWKQRAKRRWVNEGDKNTKYFHAVATNQKRKNSISSLLHEGSEVTSHMQKAKIFFDYYCALVGSQEERITNFDLHTAYGQAGLTQTEIEDLMQNWTENDIKKAISSWKGNKSPGPDGYTGEFYNAFLETILPDLKEVFMRLNQQDHATLHPLNDSYIVLVPKKKPANCPHDFRPISLVNGIQKIYSKIMADKLKPLLHKLLMPNQTGFLKDRSILHGFHYAQQVIQSAAAQKVQIATLKADIFKAFDTLSWDFLLDLLCVRGFPQSWIHSVRNRVLKGESRIILKSVAGKTIRLKRGVRQGDPISPYLFNLSIDFLSRWMQKLADLSFLSQPFPLCRNCLLYADDTLLLLQPTADQIIKMGLLLKIFGLLSGLKINMQKSELTVTSASPFLTHSLANLIGCKPATFPINYLGLPLSDRQLVRADYASIIARIQNRLPGWKASLLSIGGRIVLVNSVLSMMPQYFMSIFLLPKWVRAKIDQIRRAFLWHGHKDRQDSKGLYMVNWSLTTRPRSSGGLGIRDIHTTNQTLLSKWMWHWLQPNRPWWTEATPTTGRHDKPWNNAHSSPFWKGIASIAPAFSCSVMHQIENGNGTQFWEDNWEGKPLKFLFPNIYRFVTCKHDSVSHLVTNTNWIQQLPVDNFLIQTEKAHLLSCVQRLQLLQGQGEDKINWMRTGSTFSVKSLYTFISNPPCPTSTLKYIWQIRAPLRVRVFAWLLLLNRLTTVDNLVRRGWSLPNMCIMCKKDEESVSHLFQHCTLTREIKEYTHSSLSAQFGVPISYANDKSFTMLMDPAEAQNAKQLEITICFIIWRERCRRIFSGKFVDQIQLIREIRMEYSNWFS